MEVRDLAMELSGYQVVADMTGLSNNVFDMFNDLRMLDVMKNGSLKDLMNPDYCKEHGIPEGQYHQKMDDRDHKLMRQLDTLLTWRGTGIWNSYIPSDRQYLPMVVNVPNEGLTQEDIYNQGQRESYQDNTFRCRDLRYDRTQREV